MLRAFDGDVEYAVCDPCGIAYDLPTYEQAMRIF